MSDDTDETTETLEPIAYISRSENRLQVLEALTETITKPGQDTPGYEPRELREVTRASEATVSRILNEFDQRGWAERDVEGEYTATPLGQSIAIEFTPLIDSMEAIQHLGDAVALLPLNELTIDLEHFQDAKVREPEGPPDVWFLQYTTALQEVASRYYGLSYVPRGPPALDELQGDLKQREELGTPDAVLVRPKTFHEYTLETYGVELEGFLKAGGKLFNYEGHISCNLQIYDETVVIENSQVEGVRDGTVIESGNESVREWALELFERYREESEEVTVEDLPE